MERRDQSGAVLVEFAILAIVVWLLLAGVLELGRALAISQVLQTVARSAARELALAELPAGATFEQALSLAGIYDPDALVVDLERVGSSSCADSLGVTPALAEDAFFASLPVANRLLRPILIRERVRVDGEERDLLRYPGALLRARGEPTSPCASGLTVAVPELDGDSVRWVAPLEELDAASFAFDPAEPTLTGVASLRFNYPFQSVGLSSWIRDDAASELEGREVLALEAADDGALFESNPQTRPGALIDELDSAEPSQANGQGAYSGRFGLGRQQVLSRLARPFRRVLRAQAIARRELFAADVGTPP